ncbi:hypothetical protein ACH4L5_36590 [Streptomyces sp. NPDC017405]|uniref:hypothetical protein n=1 Tax=unclassified Streptomyces TaxID=2593676 RepID=UPI00379D967F
MTETQQQASPLQESADRHGDAATRLRELLPYADGWHLVLHGPDRIQVLSYDGLYWPRPMSMPVRTTRSTCSAPYWRRPASRRMSSGTALLALA